MKHYFSFSSNVLLLFKQWKISRTAVFVDAVIGIFLFTLLFEMARNFHSRMARSGVHCPVTTEHSVKRSPQYGTFNTPPAQQIPTRRIPFFFYVFRHVLLRWRYILASCSYVILVGASYLIMLAVMTYNAWILIAVCLASGIAYYISLSSPVKNSTVQPDLEGNASIVL